MVKTSWAELRDLLTDRYEEFRARLTRRLGSEELASESLNETWLRLHRQDDAGPLQSPTGYVLRIAVNIATDRRRMENRIARRSDVNAALEIPDSSPGPDREVDGRLHLKALQRAIETLPERSRGILVAARIQGLSQKEIAERFGISPRMVRMELRRALDHCEAGLEKGSTNHSLSGPSQTLLDETLQRPPVSPRSKRDSGG